MEKKLIRRVLIHLHDGIQEYEVGRQNVVAINMEGNSLKVFFRAEGEDDTPAKMEDRPMRLFNGYQFIIEDALI